MNALEIELLLLVPACVWAGVLSVFYFFIFLFD